MSKLHKVTLHAARSKTFPEGSIRHGYEFIAPLTAEGKIDAEAWKAHRGECFARRFWGDDGDERGRHAGREREVATRCQPAEKGGRTGDVDADPEAPEHRDLRRPDDRRRVRLRFEEDVVPTEDGVRGDDGEERVDRRHEDGRELLVHGAGAA